MAYTAPPSRTGLNDTYPLPSNATFKSAIGALWDFVTGLLGTTGNPEDAQEALKVRGPADILNLSIVPSVAVNALTIALKTRALADPSAADPVYFGFRNATIGTGNFSVSKLSAAHSLVISSGSTMGASSGVAFRLWLVEFNDAGTLRLGAVNCRSGVNIMALKDDAVYTSVAEGGAGAADSAQVIYANALVAAKALRVIGYLEWASGLTTAGTWDAVPTKVQLFGPGVPLPGQMLQSQTALLTSSSSGSTILPRDNTIPQNTEGDQYMSQAITPTSSANLLFIAAKLQASNNGGPSNIGMALFQDATANALSATVITTGGTGYGSEMGLCYPMLAGTAAATTFKIRAGPEIAGTINVNAIAGGQVFNGTANSFLSVAEVMA